MDILSLVRTSACKWPEGVALWSESGGAVRFGDLSHRVQLNAARLHAFSAGRRLRVGITLPNGPGMAVTLLSVAAVGTALPFNPKYQLEEFKAYFRETSIEALIVSDSEGGPAVGAARELGLPVLRSSPDGTLLMNATPGSFPREPHADDVALVLLTSGSTGRAKAVPLTHRNVCTTARDVCRSMELSPDDRCLSMWEQYHVGGLVDLLLAPLLSGGCVICTSGFDAASFLRLLRSAEPTWFQAVPTALNELVNQVRKRGLTATPNRLRLIRSVAAPLPIQTQDAVQSLFGVPVVQTYGLTEAGPLVTSTAVNTASKKPRSLGRSCGTQIRIFTDDWQAAPPLAVGPIAIRGANVFLGYENDSEANLAQFRDGWFLTGDLGYLDAEGDLFVTGRTKQLINRGGEKVNPQEVDDALQSHPAVSTAAVFTIPHKTLGEDVAAAITLCEGCHVTAGDLREFLGSRLAAFKIPSRFWFLEELPRNAIGKIDSLALTEMAKKVSDASVVDAPPGDELQQFLADLWATELDLDRIGIDGDFSALGGDSLSRGRILVVVEKALGIKIPEEVIPSFATIRGMAAWLIAASPDGQGLASGGHLSERLASASTAIESMLERPRGPNEEEAIAEKEWNRCEHANESRVMLDRLLLYRTPHEVSKWLGAIGFWAALPTQPWLRAPWRSLLVTVKKGHLLRDLRREFHGTGADPRWNRTVHTENSFLYADPTVKASAKTLLVGFCGTFMRLMIPVYGILMRLDPEDYDLLLVRDPDRQHFDRGTPGLGESIEAVAAALAAFADDSGYRRTVALGTSGGGLAAICVGLLNGYDKVIAVSPDAPLRHPSQERCLTRLAKQPGPVSSTEVRLCYGSLNVRDQEAADSVASLLPGARLFPEPTYNHNVIHELNIQRRLNRFLQEHLAEEPVRLVSRSLPIGPKSTLGGLRRNVSSVGA